MLILELCFISPLVPFTGYKELWYFIKKAIHDQITWTNRLTLQIGIQTVIHSTYSIRYLSMTDLYKKKPRDVGYRAGPGTPLINMQIFVNMTNKPSNVCKLFTQGNVEHYMHIAEILHC